MVSRRWFTTIIPCVIVVVAMESTGSFATLCGAVTVFNGGCLALLSFLTQVGINTETTATWEEVRLSPGRATTSACSSPAWGWR